MVTLHRENGIAYELLDAQNVMECAACVAQVFSKREPLAEFLGVTQEELYLYTSTYYPLLIQDQLTLVARDMASGQVIGARVSEDLMRDMPSDAFFEACIVPKLAPIFALLDDLNKSYVSKQQIEKGEYVHMFMIAVSDAYLNRGIAPLMNRIFFNHAKSLGYIQAITEPTGLISQHVLRDKLGFEVIGEQAYDSWNYRGQAVFRGIPKHRSAMLMLKKL